MSDQVDLLTGEARDYTLPVSQESKRYNITPVAEPRQVQSDKWRPRTSVLRYRAFKDEVRLHGVQIRPTGDRVIFLMPMPPSWSQKRRAEMLGQPHQSKPDTDNLLKALWDAVHSDDQHIFHADALKFWGERGEIIIEPGPEALGFDGNTVIWSNQ